MASIDSKITAVLERHRGCVAVMVLAMSWINRLPGVLAADVHEFVGNTSTGLTERRWLEI